jgi:SAM-dependent methyltransferase
MTQPGSDEPAAIAERYARRAAAIDSARYSLFNAAALSEHHARQRAMVELLRRGGWNGLSRRSITEVGCGSGGNLLDLLRLGAEPDRLTGIELLPERAASARERLPSAVRLIEGDAAQADIAPASQDAVLAFTVFSSLLDDGFQQRLADAMWRWVRPGGGVLWYDFTVDNPRNPDVRGVPLPRVAQLFPQALVHARRVTLAPPLARAACALHPGLYTLLNVLPWLRTHVLAWLGKP